jgi:hypothetical protein
MNARGGQFAVSPDTRLGANALSPDTRDIMTYLAMRWRGLADQGETQKPPLQPKRRTLPL